MYTFSLRTARGLSSTVVVLLLAACGGGGGGGGGTSAVQYSGNTSAAVVTTTDSSQIVANVFGGDTSTINSSVTGVSTGTTGAPQQANGGLTALTQRLNAKFRASLVQASRAGSAQRSVLEGASVNDTESCQGGGSVHTSGTLNNNGTGTLTLNFNNCRTDDETLSGQANVRIDMFDFGLPTDFTVSFGRLAIRGTGVSLDTGGSTHVQLNIPANTETITDNLVSLDNLTRGMTKTDNLVFVNKYDNILSPSSYSTTLNGRIFDSVLGYVDVATAANMPAVFSSLTQLFPESGQMSLTGGNGTGGNGKIQVTALSATLAKLELDLDGNGAFENAATLKWTDLSGPVGSDLGDDDLDRMHNSWEDANNLDRHDPTEAALDNDSDGASNLGEYQAGTDPNVANFARIVNLPDNSNLLFDAGTQRIYASILGNPGVVRPIDPATGIIGTAIPVGANPTKLARSDNGQFLYVGLDGQSSVQRIDLATQTVTLTIPLGSDSMGSFSVEDMEVLPGSPQSVAVSRKYQGLSPRHAGVAIYDGVVQRPVTTPGHTGSNAIEFSASAGTLYGYNNETTEFGFRRMAVNASGVSIVDVFDSFMGDLISGFGVDIKFHGGLIYTTTGRVIDPVARTVLGTFSLPTASGNLVTADATIGRAFFLTPDGSSGTWSLRAFDLTTRQFLSSLVIPGLTGNPGSLIRWGAKGLAFRTSSGQVHLIVSSSLVP